MLANFTEMEDRLFSDWVHERPESKEYKRKLLIMENTLGKRYLEVRDDKGNYACLMSFAAAYDLNYSKLFKWCIGRVDIPTCLDIYTDEWDWSVQFFDINKFWTFFPEGVCEHDIEAF